MNFFHLPQKNTLTLIFYPAPYPIDWSSPGKLLRSSIKCTMWGWEKNLNVHLDPQGNLIKVENKLVPFTKHPHPISHVDVCLTSSSGEAHYTGMARIKSFEEISSALTGKSTFDKLFKDFPGKLIEHDEIVRYLKRSLYLDKARWITYTLSDEVYEYLLNYYNEYKEKKFHDIYAGFHAEPLRGEGAGCAHFARSFLRVANLNSNELEEMWKIPLRIPYRLIPSKPEPADTNVLKMIMATNDSQWAQGEEDSIDLDIFDPGIMYEKLRVITDQNKDFIHHDQQTILNSTGLIVHSHDHQIDLNKSYWLD